MTVFHWPPDKPGTASLFAKKWSPETQAFMVGMICEVCRTEYGLTPQQITDAFCIEHTTGWYAIKEGTLPQEPA